MFEIICSYYKKKNPDKYKRQFSQYVENNIEPNGLADLYAKVHAAIRKDPSSAPKKPFDKTKIKHKEKQKRMTLEEKRANRLAKIQKLKEANAAAAAASAATAPATTTNTTTAMQVDAPKTQAAK